MHCVSAKAYAKTTIMMAYYSQGLRELDIRLFLDALIEVLCDKVRLYYA